MWCCVLSPRLRGLLGGAAGPEVISDFKCFLSGEEGTLEARTHPDQRSEGQSSPSVIRGDPDLRDY